MKLQYEQGKRRRVKRFGFYSVTNYDGYWWKDDKWVKNPSGECCSHYWGCRSTKSFIRLLKKWRKYLPKGITFYLVSRWQKHDVIGKI